MKSLVKMNLIFLMVMLIFMTLVMESFFMVWVFMEMTTLVFLFILNLDNSSVSSSSLKYFVIQALASMLMIIFFTFFISNEFFLKTKDTVMTMILVWKTGMAPVHSWFMNIIMDISWNSFFLISTLMKITPLFLMTFFFSALSYIVMTISVATPVLAGVSQSCFKKIMGLSSIFTSGWILSSMPIGGGLWLKAFLIYSLLLLLFCKAVKDMPMKELDMGAMKTSNLNSMIMFLILLSLSGIPPFSGFFIKIFIVVSLLKEGLVYISLFLLLLSALSVYMYLKLVFKYMSMMNLTYSTKIKSSELISFVTLNLVSALIILI